MNYSEILSTLQTKISDVRDFALNDFDEENLGLGPINKVHSEGGEGQGEHWERVYHFPDHDVYISVVGFYSSYDGVDFYDGWGCCSNVRPVQKTITVYE